MRIISAFLFCMICLPVSAQIDNIWSYSFNLEAAGNYEDAAELLQGSLDDAGDREYAEMRIAWLYYQAAEYSMSVKHYENSLKINEQSLEARLGLMLPLMAQQRWREAAQKANEVIAESSLNYYAHTRLMICEEALGLWDDLISHAEEMHVYYPADATILVYLARAYANTNRVGSANAAYQKVLYRFPGHIEAMQYLNR